MTPTYCGTCRHEFKPGDTAIMLDRTEVGIETSYRTAGGTPDELTFMPSMPIPYCSDKCARKTLTR